MATDFRRHDARRPSLASRITINGVSVTFHPGRPCAGSGADRASSTTASASSPPATTSASPTATCAAFEPVALRRVHHRGDLRPARLPAPARHATRSAGCSARSKQFPERAHLVGAYALRQGAARDAAAARMPVTKSRSTSMARWQRSARYYQSRGIDLGDLRPATRGERARKSDFAGAIVIGPPSAFADRWARRFPRADLLLRVGLDAHPPARQAARRRAAADHLRSFRLGRADRDDRWRPAPAEVWVTHGREEALVRWCELARASRRGRCISSATRTRAIDGSASPNSSTASC